MGRKKKKTKLQEFVNKYYMPLLLLFVFGVLLTAAIIDRNKKYDTNDTKESIIMEQGWSINEKTDYSIKIYGSDFLSTDSNQSDIYHEYYCKSKDCLFIHGNDNFALIDDDKYVVYSLIDDAVFDIPKKYDLDESEFLVHNNILYGLIFKKSNYEVYYSLKDEAYLFEDNRYYIDRTSNIIVNDRKLLLYSNEYYYLYDLDTGNILFESPRIEINYSKDENDYYYITYEDNKVKNIYTSNLYEINVHDAIMVSVMNKNFIYTVDGKTFIVKDIKDEIVLVSNEYDEIYEFMNGYVFARGNDNLLIMDFDEEIIKTIPLNGYNYDNYRSGYYETNNKLGFHLFLNKDEDNIEVFFNPDTSEYYQINN